MSEDIKKNIGAIVRFIHQSGIEATRYAKAGIPITFHFEGGHPTQYYSVWWEDIDGTVHSIPIGRLISIKTPEAGGVA
jgi:hypothetical protein